MFHVAHPDSIRAGKITDVYFARTLEILTQKGITKKVHAEFIAKTLPDDWEWAVFAGLEECAEILTRLPVSVRALKEGTFFYPLEPVLEIEGEYKDFCVYETALLGLICQASGIATRAARCRQAAGHRSLISFGARRMHPALAPMIERAAFLGGCDGVAVIASAELIGEEPMGTMPHALILLFGDTLAATLAFHEVIPSEVKRTALIDTFNDEKFEAIRIAEALGSDLFGVRLDTPASRRGDFYRILEEVRWELDQRGFNHVKLFVSGGINEESIRHLNPVADGYGVGTFISNSPVVDFAMDIMEIEGIPTAKRGKWSGRKRVLACPRCRGRSIAPYRSDPRCSCGAETCDLLVPFTDNAKLLSPLPKPREIRDMVLSQLKALDAGDLRGDPIVT